jgi:cytochrome c-type biogenesis protein CcmF
MVPLLGRSLILLSLLVAILGAMLAFAAAARRSAGGALWTRRAAYAFAAIMALANGLMVYALLARDFSVGYVAQVGSRAVPAWVAVVSLWSSLEGSILFWGLVLGAYVAAATWNLRKAPADQVSYATGVWLATGAFFAFLLAGPAQPFATVSPVLEDGPGPNPLLQNHLLMIAHPPFLYLGYVGMTIPFGLASAALLTGRLGADFLRPLRLWLMLPWTFLTVAIVLGGWWAYEVLGWGGYWAWDPVENASFLPWLTATAALHSGLLMERKGILKGWTVTLIQASFLLTILGTFMTRSGVFNSVHSFTQSAIGPTLLVFLAVALIWSVVLLATGIDRLGSSREIGAAASRESMFLMNNLLFVLFTFTVLIGTVFPLVVEAVRGVQMSVGRPYFDRMAVPIGVSLLLLLGVGPALPWGRATSEEVRRALLPPAASGLVAGALGLALGVENGWTLLTVAFGGYALHVTLKQLWVPARLRVGSGLGAAAAELLLGSRRRTAGYLVHLGAILIIVSIAVSSTEGRSTEVELAAGESATLGAYTLTFVGAEEVQEPHRVSTIARVAVRHGGRDLGVVEPRMNQYEMQRQPIGTPAVRTGLTEDLYLSVMNVDPAGQRVGLLALVNPMVGWIWVATGIMGLGGVLALVPVRRPQRRPAASPVAAAVPEGMR